MSKSGEQGASATERRKARRRPILHSFSLFVVVPKKGVHRLDIHDVSEVGIKFSFDTEGEDLAVFPINQGDPLDIHLYLNQSLFLPLSVSVTRVDTQSGIRRLGGEFTDLNSAGYRAFASFLNTLDEISAAAHLVT